jgi:hypothetical protein
LTHSDAAGTLLQTPEYLWGHHVQTAGNKAKSIDQFIKMEGADLATVDMNEVLARGFCAAKLQNLLALLVDAGREAERVNLPFGALCRLAVSSIMMGRKAHLATKDQMSLVSLEPRERHNMPRNGYKVANPA